MAGDTEVEFDHTQTDGQSTHSQAMARAICGFRDSYDRCYDSSFQGFGRNRDGITGDDFRCRSGTSDDYSSVRLQGPLSLRVLRKSLAARLDHPVTAWALHMLAHRDGLSSETTLA